MKELGTIQIFITEEEINLFLQNLIVTEEDPPDIIISVPELSEEVAAEFMVRGTHRIYHKIPKENLVVRCEEIEKELTEENKGD